MLVQGPAPLGTTLGYWHEDHTMDKDPGKTQRNGNLKPGSAPAARQRISARGHVVFLEDECKGCMLCVDVCPPQVLGLSDKLNPLGHRYVELLDFDRCTGCALCYVECPGSAIVVYRRKKDPGSRVLD